MADEPEDYEDDDDLTDDEDDDEEGPEVPQEFLEALRGRDPAEGLRGGGRRRAVFHRHQESR